MASTIIIKNGTSGAPGVAAMSQGELAINVANGQLFYGTVGGTAVSSSFTFSDITASGDIKATNINGTRLYENGSAVSTIYAPIAGSENQETVGALANGSITAGFGNIDNGTSGIRSNNITAETSFLPDANDGATLGTTDLQFSDLFLAEGGVINFDNGDVTITQTGNDLDIAGTSNTSFVGHITASGNIKGVDVYADKIRRASDSANTTKILLNDEVMKFHAGHSTDETLNLQLNHATLTPPLTASGDISASAASTASFGAITADRWDYTNILAIGKIASTNSNANWYVAGANGMDAGNWNADTGVATTTVNSSTATIARQPAACGIPIPFDCELIGFRALGRNNSNASNAWSASLWTYIPNHGISTANTTITLSAYQTSSLANTGFPADATGESGSSWAGPGHATDLKRTLPLRAGSAILPALKCDDGRTDTCIVSFTLVLRTKISDIVGSEFTVVDQNN